MKTDRRNAKRTVKFPPGRNNPNRFESHEFTELPQTALLRVKQVLRYVPVSRSSWWQGVKEGRFPKPVKLSKRCTAWRASDIRLIVEGM